MSNVFSVGDKVNNWTISGLAESKRTPKGQIKYYWPCVCICGNQKTVYAGSLKSGKSKSCGCIRIDKKEYGAASKHNVFLCYKNRAKRKGINFDLSKEEFLDAVSKPCFYCGKTLSNYMKAGKRNGGFSYNGIDRFDNTKGYVKDNCIPCCINCNKAKLDQTHEEFLNMVESIYSTHLGNKLENDNGKSKKESN